ncbi:MAG TPA: hypothetical protein VNW90_10675 [Acetobacteraceae bacterium]|nr:hypothetical protein [Acetobacteraceae bacterium]
MTSRVDITNRALQALGTRSTIASMDEGSNESNNASLVYDAARQECIRAAPWNFCTATATLALLKSAPGTVETPAFPTSGVWSNAYPPPGWSYEYAYPADCLRARKVVPNYSAPSGGGAPIFPTGSALATALPFWEMPGVRFQVTTDKDHTGSPLTCILANLDQGILCYLRDVTVEDIWDPSFTEAMVSALAGKLANTLTGDKGLSKEMYGLANQTILAARANDANEGLTVIQHEPDWIWQAHGIRTMARGQSGFVYPYGALFGV